MKAAFYSGKTGMMAQQEAMDIIGNNLANVNTNGYQSQAVSFNSLMHKKMYVNAEEKPLTGYGVKSVSGGIKVGTNSIRTTDENLDFAIAGEGFFAVESNGTIRYTRDGSFALSVDGDEQTLTTSDGWKVLDESGSEITLEKMQALESTNTNATNTGDDYEETDYAKLLEQIGIYRFKQPSALGPSSANRYEANELSGEAEAMEVGTYNLLQGKLEISGTSVADEMSNMILAQRAFQISARVVQTADEIEQTINGLRK